MALAAIVMAFLALVPWAVVGKASPSIVSVGGSMQLRTSSTGTVSWVGVDDDSGASGEAKVLAVQDDVDAVDSRVTALTEIVETKANIADVPLNSSLPALVDSFAANTSTFLGRALSNKANINEILSLDDVQAKVESMVDSAGAPNKLQQALADLSAKVAELLDANKNQCGGACEAGQYVVKHCDGKGQQTECEPCNDGSFSAGGYPSSCTPCSSCGVNEYLVANCTKSIDTQCAPCARCVWGLEFQLSDCNATAQTQCQRCQTCNATSYESAPCTMSTDRQCSSCSATTCPSGQVLVSNCSTTADIVCRPMYTGFRADIVNSIAVTAAGWFSIVGTGRWSTASGALGLFNGGSAFNTNGIFTAPVDGVYMISALVRINGADTSAADGNYFRLLASINDGTDITNGLHAIASNFSTSFHTLIVSGAAMLKAGNTVRLKVFSFADTSYTVDHESGFSVMAINMVEGVAARKTTASTFKYTGTVQVPTWSVIPTANFGFLTGGFFNGDQGTYTALNDGYFYVAANMRLDGASAGVDGYFRLLVAVNNMVDVDNGLHAIQGQPASPHYYTMHVSGLLRLRKGDVLSVQVFSSADNDWVAFAESSFYVIGFGNAADVQGFSADMSSSLSVNAATASRFSTVHAPGWTRVAPFRTNAGHMFNLNNNFDEATGVFTAPDDGIYLVSANTRIDNANGRYMRQIVAINANMLALATADGNGLGINNNGLHTIRGQPLTPSYVTFSTTGVVHLNKGDTLSLLIFSFEDADYTIQSESGFSAVMVVPGGMCASCPPEMTQSTACTVNSNRQCKPCKPSCNSSEFESTPCTQATDRVCTPCSSCPTNFVPVQQCTNVTNTVCVPAVSLLASRPFSAANEAVTNKANIWVAPTGWITSAADYPSLHRQGPTTMFNANNGIFSAPNAGYYFVTAAIRVDAGNGEFSMIVAVNGNTDPASGLFTTRSNIVTNYYSLIASGVVSLTAGSTLQPLVRGTTDADYKFEDEHSFSVVQLDVKEGFSAVLNADISINTGNWATLSGWRINSASVGGFRLGRGFVTTSGVYTVQSAGVFYFAANVRILNWAGQYIRLNGIINNQFDYNNGLHVIEGVAAGETASTSFTLTATGIVYLQQGDTFSLSTVSVGDSAYIISSQSSFSLVRINGTDSIGAFGEMVSDSRFHGPGWAKAVQYRLNSPGLFSNPESSLNVAGGEFVAPVKGGYICAANTRVDQAQTNYLRLVVAVNGAQNSLATSYNNGLHAIKGSPTSSYISFSFSGVMILNATDSVAVFIFNNNDPNDWYIQHESSFGCALVYPLP